MSKEQDTNLEPAQPLPLGVVGRGRERWGLKRALIGAIIGGIALPAFALSLTIATTRFVGIDLTVLSQAEVGAIQGIIALQITTGAILGVMVANRSINWRLSRS